MRDAGRHLRRDGDGGGRRRSGGSRRPARRRIDRRRRQGGTCQARRARRRGVGDAPRSSPGSEPPTRSSISGATSREGRRRSTRTFSDASARVTRRTRSTCSASSGPLASDASVRLVATTRRPDLVPEGIEPVELASGSQALRMAWSLPRTLRRLGADLVHTQYAVPLRCPCPAVVTVHDVSFARDPDYMGWKDRTIFRRRRPARDAEGRARPHGVGADEGGHRGAVRHSRRSGSS